VTDPVVIRVMRKLALLAAEFWKDEVKPAKFDQVFYLPNGRVRLTIDEFTTPHDTKPIGRADDEDRIIED
jgi:hypothetical protein